MVFFHYRAFNFERPFLLTFKERRNSHSFAVLKQVDNLFTSVDWGWVDELWFGELSWGWVNWTMDGCSGLGYGAA